jgi:hypothetical protein
MKTVTIDGVEYNLTPIKKQSKPIILEQHLKFEVYPKDLGQHNWEDAKKVCEDLGDGWRIPTILELNIMRFNRGNVNGFTDEYYWSSNEINNNYVWSKFFANGGEYYTSKDDTGYVRAVRDVMRVE